ncbi:hypothetical protein [Streptomyces aureus]
MSGQRARTDSGSSAVSGAVPLVSRAGLIRRIGLQWWAACSTWEDATLIRARDGFDGVGQARPSDVLAADKVGVLPAVEGPQFQCVIQEFRTVGLRHFLDADRQHPGIASAGAGILDEEEEHPRGPGGEGLRVLDDPQL